MIKKSSIKFIIIGAVMVVLILGYYYYISNIRKKPSSGDDAVNISAAAELTMRNLENNYPPTPKEVVKFYSDINVMLYSGEYTDEEFVGLAEQMRYLFDDELAANTPYEQYMTNLKTEIAAYREKGLRVTSYATLSATDVFYFSENGFKWARTNVAYTLRQGKDIGLSKETFVLRKDPEGHWKIYGWAVTDDEDDNGGGDETA